MSAMARCIPDRIFLPILVFREQNRMWAAGGMIVSATITEAIKAKVLVNARGLNNLPSAPIIVKTGRKLTTVVETAVKMALPTSLAAR